jgi:hypothetical protein
LVPGIQQQVHEVKRLRIGSAVHLLPQYAFMACTGTGVLLFSNSLLINLNQVVEIMAVVSPIVIITHATVTIVAFRLFISKINLCVCACG